MLANSDFRKIVASHSLLLCGVAAIALTVFPPNLAQAQPEADQVAAPDVETVVVTGTSIRGIAPVGSNLVAVDRPQIEATGAQTMQQLYTSLPMIASFGVGDKPSEGITGIESSPTIHNFGESSSASTLLLMNGRPIMPQGSLGVGDPSVIPTIAIARVDVMPDGDSAVYGSSAVAGVINFITRKNFEGVDTQASFGRASQYNRASDLTGSFCTKRIDRNWLGKELGHAEEEADCGADSDAAAAD